jgi:hypothetical protein
MLDVEMFSPLRQRFERFGNLALGLTPSGKLTNAEAFG